MMMSRYAALLTDYCLRVVPGERVLSLPPKSGPVEPLLSVLQYPDN